MGSAGVLDPDGVHWSVRRRWYPWRRQLSLRDLMAASLSGTTTEAEPVEPTDAALPRNAVLKVSFVVLAAIVWVVYGLGRVLFYTVVVVLFLVGSLIELVLELVVMPITLLLRLIGQSRWPIEIGRGGEHFGIRHAGDFAAAGELRDGLIADIQCGVLPAGKPASVG